MRSFSSLVASTPQRFKPISDHVLHAIFEQRVGDRVWIHLPRMQPSLFQFQEDVQISVAITDSDSSNEDVAPQWSTHRRLFAGLPRIPPTVCLRCESLFINSARFITTQDLIALLGRLISPGTNVPRIISVKNVTWNAQTRVDRGLLTGQPLEKRPGEYRSFWVEVTGSRYIAETAWLCFVTCLRCISQRSMLPNSPCGLKKISTVWRISSAAQRTVLAICTLLSQTHKKPKLKLYLNHSLRRSSDSNPQRVILSEDCAAGE